MNKKFEAYEDKVRIGFIALSIVSLMITLYFASSTKYSDVFIVSIMTAIVSVVVGFIVWAETGSTEWGIAILVYPVIISVIMGTIIGSEIEEIHIKVLILATITSILVFVAVCPETVTYLIALFIDRKQRRKRQNELSKDRKREKEKKREEERARELSMKMERVREELTPDSNEDLDTKYSIMMNGFENDLNVLKERDDLVDYRNSLSELIASCNRIGSIVNEDNRQKVKECAVSILFVYHTSYLYMSKLYRDKENKESVVNELYKAKAHKRYVTSSEDINSLVEEVKRVEGMALSAINRQSREDADLMIKNLVDKL